MKRKYSNFGFGFLFLTGPTLLALVFWSLSVFLRESLPLLPFVLGALPLQLIVVWLVWKNREDFVQIVHDPGRRTLKVSRISSARSFDCLVDEIIIEDGQGRTYPDMLIDNDASVYRVSAGKRTVLTWRSFSQCRIRAMLREWSE